MEYAKILETVQIRTRSAMARNVSAKQGLQVIPPKRNVLQVSFLKTEHHHTKKKLNKLHLKVLIKIYRNVSNNIDFNNHS